MLNQILESSVYFFKTEHPCDENAEAHMINGVIDCFCKRGYYGNGKTCSGLLYIDDNFVTFVMCVLNYTMSIRIC